MLARILLGCTVFCLFAVSTLAAAPLKVTVSIPPQAYVVEQIAGKLATVSVLLPDGKSPHDYAPLPSQVTALADSRIFFTVGLPFEKTIADKIRGQTAGAIVDMSAGIKRRNVDEHDHDHDHAKHDKHDADHDCCNSEFGDPHIWTSPVNLKLMAANVCTALAAAEPQHAALFRANYEKFSAAMDTLDRRIAAELAPYKGHVLYVYHPAFGYFTDRYQLKQEAIEDQGKDPSPKQIMELIAAARKDGVHVIIVQKQFNTRSAEKIASAINGKVLPVDNLDRDAVRMIENIAAAVKQGVSK